MPPADRSSPPSPSAPSYDPPPLSPPPAREPWTSYDTPEPAGRREPEPEPERDSGGLFSRLRGGRRAKHQRDPPPPAAHEPELDPFEPTARPTAAHEPGLPAVGHEPDIVPADDEPDGEDLLEETPEFLEETPEHDRLWFEQRPPRDFKFDD